jgi:hypothetical protein
MVALDFSESSLSARGRLTPAVNPSADTCPRDLGGRPLPTREPSRPTGALATGERISASFLPEGCRDSERSRSGVCSLLDEVRNRRSEYRVLGRATGLKKPWRRRSGNDAGVREWNDLALTIAELEIIASEELMEVAGSKGDHVLRWRTRTDAIAPARLDALRDVVRAG